MDNPEKEWRRLTELYGGMCDEALLELAADFADLTELAQMALEQALQVAAKPIPQEIVDESKIGDEPQEFHMPVCRAAEPVLEAVEPSTRWRCEICGNVWSDGPR